MYRLKIISVGKIKKDYWLGAMEHYEKMLRPMLKIEAVIVKDCSHLQGEERKRMECGLILQKISAKERVIALTEHGNTYDSPGFAAFMRGQLEASTGECCLIIAGAFGFAADFLERADSTLSLSSLTMPHELAHVVLYEQLFRAMTIIQQRTYHY